MFPKILFQDHTIYKNEFKWGTRLNYGDDIYIKLVNENIGEISVTVDKDFSVVT